MEDRKIGVWKGRIIRIKFAIFSLFLIRLFLKSLSLCLDMESNDFLLHFFQNSFILYILNLHQC